MHQVSCELKRGAICALMGPNGAGKSTLLDLLATSGRPTEGELLFGTKPQCAARDSLRGRVGLLAHASLLYGELTVRENLRFWGHLNGVSRTDDAVRKQIDDVDLAWAADRPVHELSRGMVQRAAIARCLLSDPDILLLDEPFSGLDTEGVAILRGLLTRYRGGNAFVVITTHLVGSLDGLCDQQLVLCGARLVSDVTGTAFSSETLSANYRNAVGQNDPHMGREPAGHA